MSTSTPADASNSPPPTLFNLPDEPPVSAKPATARQPQAGRPRIKSAVRNQRQFLDTSLDELVPEDCPVRSVWDLVANADLSELYNRIQAVEGGVGRDAIDPAFNLQFATDNESGIIVGMDINNLGGDKGLITPMIVQIKG